jgi:hypothetical protein
MHANVPDLLKSFTCANICTDTIGSLSRFVKSSSDFGAKSRLSLFSNSLIKVANLEILAAQMQFKVEKTSIQLKDEGLKMALEVGMIS